VNSPLEDYLEILRTGLKPLPIHERLEQLDEARAHLEGLTQGFEAQGHARPVAEFGEATELVRQLNRAATRRRWGHTVGVAAIYWGLVSFLSLPLHSLFSLGSVLYKTQLHRNPALWGGYLVLVTVLTGLVAGALLRRLTPGNTLRPLLLVGILYGVFALRFPLPVGFPLFAHGLWGTLLSLLTSGALEELPEALLRWRRRVA
jgi:hypothetical protein